MRQLLEFAIYTPVGFTLLAGVSLVCLYFLIRVLQEVHRAGMRSIRFVRSLFPRFGARFFLVWFLLSVSGYMVRGTVIDFAAYAVQSYFDPVYFSVYNADSTSATEQAYIRKLRTRVTENQYEYFMAMTEQMAAEHQSTVLAFLEVYESECGMNPFACNVNENGDTVAAGPIQFTRVGIGGLELNGVTATMRRVKDAVISKDLRYLIELQCVYLRRAAGGRPLRRSCDVYTAVFMPSFIGKPDNTVLACSACDRPDFYFENAPALDGYRLDGDKILKSPRYRDGKITINDLSLALTYKKAAVVKQWGI